MAVRGRLFAILDACEDPPVFDKVQELGPDRALCLHGGGLEAEEKQCAPYLVKVDRTVLDWILDELWGRPWGIFVVAECDERTLRPHFRRQLVVEGPEGEPMYLRFYDPRVLGNLIAVFHVDQIGELLGPALGFGIPEKTPGVGTLYLKA
jgi:hypothetical protein